MGINHVKFTQTGEIEKYQKIAQQLKDQLLYARAELEKGDNYYEYLDSTDQAKMRAMKLRLDAEIKLLDVFIETGHWGGDESLNDYFENYLLDQLPDLSSGWNGHNLQYLSTDSPEYLDYEAAIAEDPDKYGELDKVIMVPGTSDVPPVAALVLKDKDNVKKVSGETVGKDIWITVEFKNDDKKTYILKELAVRPEVQIYIYGRDLTEGIIMDFSRVVRVGNPHTTKYGDPTNGLILVGGKGDDIIIGSQSADTIVGWEGHDRLYGMGGVDQIFGDGVYKSDSGLLSINDATGGNDYIDGGDGVDTIYGGGGIDKAVSDPRVWGGEDGIDIDVEERVQFAGAVGYSDADAFINEMESGLKGFDVSGAVDPETGEIIVWRSGKGAGSIEITAPDGYTMAYANDEGNDIVITFVKMEEDDEGNPYPVYLRVRIKNVLQTGNETTIIVKGTDPVYGPTIFDFSNLNAQGNTIKLETYGGNDSILAPITNLEKSGIKPEDLKGSMLGGTDLKKILEEMHNNDKNAYVFGGEYWSSAKVEGDEIVLTPKSGQELPSSMSVNGPTWFAIEHVFYKVEGNDLVLYVVGYNKDTKKDGMYKIRIKDGAKDAKIPTITFNSKVTAMPIGMVEISTGDGTDLVVGSTGSVAEWGTDPDDAKVVWDVAVDDDNDDGVLSPCPEGLKGKKAEKDGKTFKDENGNELNWDSPAPADPSKTVYQMVEEGKDPVEKDPTTPPTPPTPPSP